jgi:hypothetical protein
MDMDSGPTVVMVACMIAMLMFFSYWISSIPKPKALGHPETPDFNVSLNFSTSVTFRTPVKSVWSIRPDLIAMDLAVECS